MSCDSIDVWGEFFSALLCVCVIDDDELFGGEHNIDIFEYT